LDEIAFVSGHKVEAWVAPEILVQHALEKHYEVPRKLRHITLSGQVRGVPTPSSQPAVDSTPDLARPVDPSHATVAGGTPPLAPLEAAIESILTAAPPEQPPDEEARSLDSDPDAMKRDARQEVPHPLDLAHFSFVEQARPRVHVAAEREDASGTRRSIDWIKYEREGCQAWCELFQLPLEDPHFNHLGGVYVIWHAGHHPVIRVGQGYIKTELTTLRLDARLESRDRESKLFVTWARVPREDRDGIERFLHDMLDPELRDQPPEADPLTVNLPC